LVTISFVSTASALVTVNATTTAISPVRVGDTIEVDILVSWDGSGQLIGIFSSHVWDSSQLDLLGAVFPLPTGVRNLADPLQGRKLRSCTQ
jgi:hypothetical protein